MSNGFKRTEAEVREYLEAAKALLAYKADANCGCISCELDQAAAINAVDILGWLLGERVSDQFYETNGDDADYTLSVVDRIIMEHKIGVYNLPVRSGT